MTKTKTLTNPFTQLCVIHGCTLGGHSPKDFEAFMMENFKVRAKFEAEVETLPDLNEKGKPVPETGGRIDLFFYAHKDDIPSFSTKRFEMGVRWWEDVVKYNNNNGHLYTQEFKEAHPATW